MATLDKLFTEIYETGDLGKIRAIVEGPLASEGIDINTKLNEEGDGGETALFAAIASENSGLDVINYLVERGAEANVTNNDGDTMFFVASSVEKLEFLFDTTNINVNATNNIGSTALYIAIRDNKPDIAKELMAKDADISIANKYDSSPIREAHRQNNIEMLRILKLATFCDDIFDPDVDPELLADQSFSPDEIETITDRFSIKLVTKEITNAVLARTLMNLGQQELMGKLYAEFKDFIVDEAAEAEGTAETKEDEGAASAAGASHEEEGMAAAGVDAPVAAVGLDSDAHEGGGFGGASE